jgi:hypothetical protein
MHLTLEQLVDLAEGTKGEHELAAHLASCERCRLKLTELRATIASINDTPVPEPSPLFWDHFQQRVAASVAFEPAPRRMNWVWWPAGAGLAAAALLLAINFDARIVLPPVPDGPSQVTSRPAANDAEPGALARVELLNDSMTDDDPSLQLVADLTATVDDPGLAVDGSAEHAVTHLSAGELRELHRLLQAALKQRGA